MVGLYLTLSEIENTRGPSHFGIMLEAIFGLGNRFAQGLVRFKEKRKCKIGKISPIGNLGPTAAKQKWLPTPALSRLCGQHCWESALLIQLPSTSSKLIIRQYDRIWLSSFYPKEGFLN